MLFVGFCVVEFTVAHCVLGGGAAMQEQETDFSYSISRGYIFVRVKVRHFPAYVWRGAGVRDRILRLNWG